MPRMEFEPTSQVFVRAKPFHASDRAPTVIGSQNYVIFLMCELIFDAIVPLKVR
jgi:hypothetical protein